VSSIIDNEQIYSKCIDKALEVMRLVTKETKSQSENRYMRDSVYRNVIKHQANMYYEFETNESFKHQQKERQMEYEQMVHHLERRRHMQQRITERDLKLEKVSLLERGDKIRRKSDGRLFTYTGRDDSGDENYAHVKEMAAPVYLPDFERVEEE
jgi:hypothetical protein